MADPPWYAVTSHGPAATVVTVESETVHTMGDSERNDTTRFSLASASVEADNLTGWPTAVACGGSKVMVWGRGPECARNARAPAGAAACVASPASGAVVTQKPGDVAVTVETEP